MKKKNNNSALLLFLLLWIFMSSQDGTFIRSAEGKRRAHIPDDLDDVIDDEEDEAWKEWGKTKPKEFDPPPDLSEMDPAKIQAEMTKWNTGPSIGFVKLQLGVRRSPDVVSEIAMKWTKVLKTGAIAAKFMAVDTNTIMFNMEKGQDTEEVAMMIKGNAVMTPKLLPEFHEALLITTVHIGNPVIPTMLKDFIFSQPESYEIKIGEYVSRRPGDPPLEEIIDTLHRQENEAEGLDSMKEPEHPKDEF